MTGKRKISSKWDHVLFRVCAAGGEGQSSVTGWESGAARLQASSTTTEFSLHRAQLLGTSNGLPQQTELKINRLTKLNMDDRQPPWT